MLRGFFGNLIFAIIARMLCGNHLNYNDDRRSVVRFIIRDTKVQLSTFQAALNNFIDRSSCRKLAHEKA